MCLLHLLNCTAQRAHKIVVEVLYKINYYYYYIMKQSKPGCSFFSSFFVFVLFLFFSCFKFNAIIL